MLHGDGNELYLASTLSIVCVMNPPACLGTHRRLTSRHVTLPHTPFVEPTNTYNWTKSTLGTSPNLPQLTSLRKLQTVAHWTKWFRRNHNPRCHSSYGRERRMNRERRKVMSHNFRKRRLSHMKSQWNLLSIRKIDTLTFSQILWWVDYHANHRLILRHSHYPWP